MGKFEATQAGGALVGGVLLMLALRKFGMIAAFAGLLAGGMAGMLLATGLFVLVFWLLGRRP